MRQQILTGLARAYPPDEPDVGSGGTDTPSTSECGCGSCIAAGAIDDCGAIGEAPTQFTIPLSDPALIAAFGSSVAVVWDSGCTWLSDTFDDVDLGDGNHDYTFKLVFSGKGIEEAVLTLEDET